MSERDVIELETDYPTFLTNLLEDWSAEIDARLAKRYSVPFDVSDPPRVIQNWLKILVTKEAYLKRGLSPTSGADSSIFDQADLVEQHLKEAANSQESLFGLPAKQSAPNESGVSKGGPRVTFSRSPYDWIDEQGDY